MELYVKDIEKIWSSGGAALVAGKNGIMRKVESYDMMEQPKMKEWLREHVLLITTGYAIRNDKEALLELIQNMHEANCSALAIKTRFFDDFPQEALQLADQLALPLFFLNNNAGFQDIVFPVMVAVVEAKNQIHMDARYRMGQQNKLEQDQKLFLELLTGKITQEEEVEHRTFALHWPPVPARVITLQLEENGDYSPLLEMKREIQIKESLRVLEKYYIQGTCVCRKKSCFCIIGGSCSEEMLKKISLELTEKTETVNNCACFALISQEITGYLMLPEIYQEITEGFRIRKMKKQKQTVVFLKDLQYDRILLHIAQQEETGQFVQRKLGPLAEYDRAHESALPETLDVLTQKHGSRKLAAEALYLHRNTMAHRIQKIQEILNTDLDNMEELQELEFACKVRRYIQNKTTNFKDKRGMNHTI